ncbi:MAG TPA: hypothetical protein VIM31_02325 [Candidatus Microsaccharimonas sp.]|jgi:hypothetical protein
MSEAEIQFHIPREDRPKGDVEKLMNAIGAFQSTIPFPIDREYEVKPVEDKPENGVMVRFVRTPRNPQTEPTLLEYGERMVRGVKAHIPEEARVRLMGHYVGILPIDALDRE